MESSALFHSSVLLLTLQIARIAAVIALLGVAAAIATPKGRLPLALRGVARILGRDRGWAPQEVPKRVSAAKRLLAFALLLAAVALTVAV